MNQREWMAMPAEKKAEFLKFRFDEALENARERINEVFTVLGRERAMRILNVSKSAYYRLRSGAIRPDASSALSAAQLSTLCFASGYSITWVSTGVGSKYLFELPLVKTTARLARDADEALLMSEQILQNLRDIENSTAEIVEKDRSKRLRLAN